MSNNFELATTKTPKANATCSKTHVRLRHEVVLEDAGHTPAQTNHSGFRRKRRQTAIQHESSSRNDYKSGCACESHHAAANVIRKRLADHASAVSWTSSPPQGTCLSKALSPTRGSSACMRKRSAWELMWAKCQCIAPYTSCGCIWQPLDHDNFAWSFPRLPWHAGSLESGSEAWICGHYVRAISEI